MAATWKINNLNYYLSKDSKDKVVYKVDYSVLDSKTVGDKEHSASDNTSISFDVETVEAVEEVLYTKDDKMLENVAAKIGDVKIAKVEAKNPWASVDFVEYDKLTEDVVIGWVKAGLGEDGVKAKEDNIAAQIDAQENPPAATKGNGVPW
tara:strand:- start:2100 stop:2549 length:450 start_codon:yes stop_codon:yes gene_type:complete